MRKCPLFVLMFVLLLGTAFAQVLNQSQKQSKDLADIYIRLVLCDLDGEHPDNLSLADKLEVVSGSPTWRMQLFHGNPSEVSSSLSVNRQIVMDASQSVEHFLADRLLPLLWGRERWSGDPNEQQKYMSQKLGIDIGNIEASNIMRFLEYGTVPSSRNAFVKEAQMPLKRWRAQLLWVERHTAWEIRTFPQVFNVPELSGEFSVIEWGEELSVDLGAYRMGFKSSFTLARSADGKVVVIWAPLVYNNTTFSSAAYVEIVELGMKQNLYPQQADKRTGPFIASFDRANVNELRTMTLRFSNQHHVVIDEMTVVVDSITGQTVTYEGKEGGEQLRLDLVLKRELSNRSSELNRWLLEERQEASAMLFDKRDQDLIIKDLEFKRSGEVSIILQKFKDGAWDPQFEARVIFDRILSSEILKRASRSIKP